MEVFSSASTTKGQINNSKTDGRIAGKKERGKGGRMMKERKEGEKRKNGKKENENKEKERS